MPAMYYVEYLTGSFLLGMETTPVELTLEWFSDNLGNIFIPLYVGTAFYSITVSSLAYYLVNHLWRSSVKKDKETRKNGFFRRKRAEEEEEEENSSNQEEPKP